MKILDDKVRSWHENVILVKAKPGVYVLYNKNQDVIYIGESENLEVEFSKCFFSNFENDACKQKTTSYQSEFVENPKEHKRQLLEEFKKKHGKIPCCNVDADLHL